MKDIEGLENSTERVLAFLDTLSVINEDGTIKTQVYTKYLNFQSNHPLEHKRGVVKTLAHRAKTVVNKKEDRRKELNHLRGALKCSGYPEWILRDLKDENSDSEKELETSGETLETPMKEKSKKCPVVILYMKGFSEQMRRLRKVWHPNIFQTNKHTATIVGETEGSRE